jgi:hypothetical protein
LGVFKLEGADTCVGGVGLFVRVFMSHAFCCADNDGVSAVVDIFNATAGTWSTANLSQARVALAATSLPNVGVAIFAGGQSACCDYLFAGRVGIVRGDVKRGGGCSRWRGKIHAWEE